MAHPEDQQESILPHQPVHYFTKPLKHYLHIEATSGIVLFACSILALIIANSPWGEAYIGFWALHMGIEIGDFHLENTLKHWINDGLMVIFFFVIGMEVKREIIWGELQHWSRASLPVAAALGGMIVPAGIYLLMETGHEAARGWGVPMATDIAFVVGCMALLGSRVPAGLRILLLSLAIVDDIGAILVIALGYTENVKMNWLIFGFVCIAFVILAQRLGVRSMAIYTILGIAVWLGFHESGVHATIAGVILGLMTPARAYLAHTLGGKLIDKASNLFHGENWDMQTHRAEQITRHQMIARETVSPLAYLIHLLHPWVAFVIMPMFALANAAVPIQASDIVSHVSLAVMAGLMLGKPLGIFLFSYAAVQSGVAKLPEGVTWKHVFGGGILSGIGFTMALFIAGLALKDESLRSAKVGVLVGSFLCAVIGMAILYRATPAPQPIPEE